MCDEGDKRSSPQAGKKKPRGKFVLVRDTENEEEKVEAAKALLARTGLSKIDTIVGIAARGIEVIDASKGRLLCRFRIPDFMADENGDWRVGAMAAVMDNVCVTTGVSSLGEMRATVIFDMSCFSQVKVEEEVEIEGNVLQDKVSLTFVEDSDGNWSAGAIASMIDNVGATSILSGTGKFKISVDFDITYFTPATSQEEVEVEAKLLHNKGKLSHVVVEIRKKMNGEMVAVGRQWMSARHSIPSKI